MLAAARDLRVKEGYCEGSRAAAGRNRSGDNGQWRRGFVGHWSISFSLDRWERNCKDEALLHYNGIGG